MGHDIRKIPAHLRARLATLIAAIPDPLGSMHDRRYPYTTA